jgi:hypothetical protein
MELKALYRLMEADAVTHARVLAPHQERTGRKIAEVCSHEDVLILHDTTELDFTQRHALEGLGQIGNGVHRGWLCHNSLAIVASSREVIGLTSQVLHVRPQKSSRKASVAQRRDAPDRESRLWLEGVQASAVAAPGREQAEGGPRVVDVCDRGADTFEFFEHEMRNQRSFVVRSAHSRALAGLKSKLHAHARRQEKLGRRTISVAGNLARSAREAVLAISATSVLLKAPAQHRGEHGDEPLLLWVVRVWEVDPPACVKGEKPLEWILLTNVRVESFEDAARIADWYACRPLIEEFHKAQKTGCHIEEMQFQYAERMQPAIALMSVIALKLLALRDASRRSDAKTRPASDLLHRDYVETLSLWRHKKVRMDMTVHEFYFALARLGGHQNRKCDGRPGWLTLWRGWEKLHLLDLGADTVRLRKRCG